MKIDFPLQFLIGFAVYTDPLVFVIAAVFGAIIGSFLNVVILRLPNEGESIIYPASHCPQCSAELSWYENIPLLSYLIQLGRCRHCKIHISFQYPLVESLMAVLSCALLYSFGFNLTALGYFLFAASLVVIIFIDIAHQIIPDSISLPGIVIGFLFSLVTPNLSWQDSLLGILCGGGVLYAVAYLYLVLRKKDGMGGGDIKLLAMLGAFLGWQSLPFILLASSLTGSIFGILTLVLSKKDAATRIPFGPFLSGAALWYLFFSKQIHYIYQAYLTGQWP